MQGQLEKMTTELADPVRYHLVLGEQKILLNDYIGKAIRLQHTGKITCVHCQRQIKKTYNQGYCYPCFIALAQCDSCIMKPENCHYHEGTCREPDWGDAFCFQPHIVYLANSSGIKVGITRQTQVPTRWMDQGAVQALPIFKVASRYISGLLEIAIAKHVSDKTNWQQMLKSQATPIDLLAQRDNLVALCAPEIDAISQRFGETAIELLDTANMVTINYPIEQYPAKIKSLCLIKTPEIAGVLQGIKGQYLLLDTGVINIRKYTGYEVALLD
jgi:hypothetical protein